MQKRKRLAICLAMAMVINLLPLNAFAEDVYNTGEGVATQTDAVEIDSQDQNDIYQDNTEIDSPDSIINEDDFVISEEDEMVDSVKMPAFSESKTVDGVTVSVSASEGVFPEGSKLSVISAPTSVEKSIDTLINAKRRDDLNVAASYTFDIKILDKDGNEIQPADGNYVSVRFTTSEVSDSNLETDVYHISHASGSVYADKLSSLETGNTVSVQSDGFSYYTVEFTYSDKQYVMNGDTSIPLSDILDYVGISGDVSAVSVSNEELFSASNDSGVWMITAHQAFKTNEWMKVVIDGVEYEIDVTDGTTYDSDAYNLVWNQGDKFVKGATYSFVDSGSKKVTWGSDPEDDDYATNISATIAPNGTISFSNGQTKTLSSSCNAWELLIMSYSGPGFTDMVYVFSGTTVSLNDATYSATTSFSYDGTNKTAVTGSNIDITGTNTATAVGDYTAYATPKSGHAWSDGTTSTKTVNWKIVKGNNPITYDSTQSVTKTYSTSAQSATLKTASNAQGTVTYSIQSQPSGNYFTLSGNTLSIAAGTPAGTYSVTVRASAAGNSNYNSGYIDSVVTVKINKADMTVTANGYSGIYDRGAHGITVSAPAGATVKYGLSASGCNSDSSPTFIDADTYTVFYKVTKTNYNDVTGSKTVIIGKKEIALSWDDLSFTYDGNPHCPTATATGLIEPDTCTVTVNGMQTNASTEAYTATAAALSNPNYKLPNVKTMQFTISAKIIDDDNTTITLGDSLTYDGTDQTQSITSIFVDDLELDEDDYDVAGNVNMDAGTYSLTITGKGNYTGSVTKEWTIAPALLTITAYEQVKTYGDDDPEFTYMSEGYKGTDTEETVLNGSLSREEGEDVGTYEITVGNLSAGNNYTIEFISNEIEITKREIVIYAEDKSRYYGEDDPELTWSVSENTPLAFDDDKDEQISITLTREEGDAAGDYPIKGSNIISNNYEVTYVEGIFTILKVEAGAEFDVEGDVNASIDKSDEEMLELTLTDEDRDMVEDGAGVRVYFDVSKAEISDNQKAQILAVAGKDAKIGVCYDINLYKKFYHMDPIQLHSISKPVTFGLPLPPDLLNVPSGYNRFYKVYTIHGNTLEELGKASPDKGYVNVTADHFSFFSVVYVDTPIKKDSATSKSTKTGDAFPIAPIVVLMFVSLTAVIIIIKAKKKLRESF